MAELRFVTGDAKWKQYRARALADLFWFADVVLGYGRVVPMTMKAHLLMCRFAERQTGIPDLDEAPVLLVKVPRGVGKSTLITQARALQLAMQHPDIAILIANEVERNAMKFLAAIKDQLSDNELLRALFPERIPQDPEHECSKWSESEVILPRPTGRKESTFQAIGVGGALAGMHPDLVICDDLIADEAAEQARATGSFQLIEKANRWIGRLRPIVNRQETWGGIVVVGTPWWEDDCYAYIEQSYGFGQQPKRYLVKADIAGESVAVECYRVGDLAVFNRPILENGTSYFPERWPDEELAKMRVDDPLLFAANMMLDPTAPEVVTFKPNWRRYYVWDNQNSLLRYKDQGLQEKVIAVTDMDVIASIDPGFTEHVDPRASRQALVATGGTGSLRFQLYAKATQQSLDGYIKDIVECCRRYKVRKLILEQEAQQRAFNKQVREALQAAGVLVSIEEISSGGKSKEARIIALEPYFEKGLFYADRNQSDFWDEYDAFPRSKHNDLLDALAKQVRFWPASAPTVGTQQQRVNDELARVYARMGKESPVMPQKQSWKIRADGSRR